MASSDPSSRLDPEERQFIEQYTQLDRLRPLVKAGKVKQEVYQQLEDSVFRARDKMAKAKAKKAAQQPRRGKNLFNLVKRPRPGRRTNSHSGNGKDRKKGESFSQSGGRRSRGASLRSLTRPRTHSNRSVSSQISTNRGRAASSAPQSQMVLDGTLLKYVKKKNRRDWKPLHVMVYRDRIDFSKAAGTKVVKTIQLTVDYYVSEVKGGVLKRADANESGSGSSDEDLLAKQPSDEVLEKPHVFVLSTINQRSKMFLAAESEERKFMFVSMIVEIIRELKNKKSKRDSDDLNAGSENVKIWDQLEQRENQYVNHKVAQKLKNVEALEGVEGEEMVEEMHRWKKRANVVARKSVVRDWRAREKEKVRQAIEENEKLRQVLQDKEKEIIVLKTETAKEIEELRQEKEAEVQMYKEKTVEWENKYEGLMEKYREELQEKREAAALEQTKLQEQLEKLKAAGALGAAGGGGAVTDENRDYVKEIEMLKKKLETMSNLIVGDFDDLDWDGTLEQAEAKMKECFALLMDGTPQEQMQAQKDFDKWDQLVRNHEDYKNREKNKWIEWENENRQKNLDSLELFRKKYVPEVFTSGCSEAQLLEITGMMPKTAARIMKNKIFKFLWMEKDKIGKIHQADLLNNYAVAGLDLREYRAVYATLPDEFQNDNDGSKKRFRESVRNKLHELTQKLADGKIKPQEEMHNDYREVAIVDKPKNIPAKQKIVRKKNNDAFKAKAAGLAAFFAGQGGGGPPAGAKKSPSKTSGPDPNDPAYAKYFKMAKMFPDQAVENKMIQDGLDPKLWVKLKKAKAAGATAAAPTAGGADDELDPNNPKYKKYFKLAKMMPDGAVRNKFIQDGLDPELWEKLKAAKASGAAAAPAATNARSVRSASANLDADSPEWAPYFKMQKMKMEDGKIMHKMRTDGKDPTLWEKLKEKKAPKAVSRTDRAVSSVSANRSPSRAAAKRKVKTAAAASSAPLDPDDPVWADYFKMRKMNMNDGAIKNRMQRDGRDPEVWSKLVRMDAAKKKNQRPKETATNAMRDADPVNSIMKTFEEQAMAESKTLEADPFPEFDLPVPQPGTKGKVNFEVQEEVDDLQQTSKAQRELEKGLQKLKKSRRSKTTTELEGAAEGGGEQRRRRKKKKKSSKLRSSVVFMEEEGLAFSAHERRGSAMRLSKKIKKQKKKSKINANMVLADTDALISRAQFDIDITNDFKRGSNALGNLMEYKDNLHQGKRGSIKGRQRVKRKTMRNMPLEPAPGLESIESNLQMVIDYIQAEGEDDAGLGGKTMAFGVLLEKFDNMMSDILVGLLLKGKTNKQLKYKGDMLFPGIHDEIRITVI